MSFCGYPWYRLSISNRRVLTPCCRYKFGADDLPLIESGRPLIEQLNDPKLVFIREQLLSGQPAQGCQKCVEQEKVGVRSLRQTSIERFGDRKPKSASVKPEDLISIELFLGRECNLKCRSCSVAFSSSWTGDHFKLYRKPASTIDLTEDIIPQLGQLAPSIDQVKLTGGEPLLARNHEPFLDVLLQHGRPEYVHIQYNTNVTKFPDAHILNRWRRFKSIEVGLSIDAYGSANNYVRHPSDWEIVSANARRYLLLTKEMPNLRVTLYPVVSIYSLPSLGSLITWWQNELTLAPKRGNPLSINAVTDPEILNPQVLPRYWKARLRSHLGPVKSPDIEGQLRFAEARDLSHRFEEFRTFTEQLDTIRDECLEEAVPFYAGIFSSQMKHHEYEA